MSPAPEAEPFGTLPDGQSVERWTLRNAAGLVVRFITYGGAITEIRLPDRDGRPANVVLSHPDLAGYLGRPGEARPYFGALIGRFANRIAGARFTLDGIGHRLEANEGANLLHGGPDGFDRQLWAARARPAAANETGVTLHYESPAGSNGFPGRVTVSVDYVLTDAGELRLHYAARTDAPTVINLTNHSYFNLGGDAAGTVDRHLVAINADHYLPVGPDLVPAGAAAPVDGTPFDFRQPREVGGALSGAHPQVLRARGFDHCWMLRDGGGAAALAFHGETGRWLRCDTTQPALQFYTGNFLDGSIPGPSGAAFRQGAGFTLETQHPPNSPNRPDFPSCRLEPDHPACWTTVFRFGTADRFPDFP